MSQATNFRILPEGFVAFLHELMLPRHIPALAERVKPGKRPRAAEGDGEVWIPLKRARTDLNI